MKHTVQGVNMYKTKYISIYPLYNFLDIPSDGNLLSFFFPFWKNNLILRKILIFSECTIPYFCWLGSSWNSTGNALYKKMSVMKSVLAPIILNTAGMIEWLISYFSTKKIEVPVIFLKEFLYSPCSGIYG